MTRLWLLALLVLTAAVAGGVLFAKFQLEALRTMVQAEIEQRTGVFLEAEGVRVDGLRGLRMRQLHMTIATETGPTLDAFVPDALLRVSLADLLQGRVSVSRIQLDDARIRLSRPRGNFWFTGDLTERSALKNPVPFRAVGKNCSVEIDRVVGDSVFRIDALDFDLNRLADSPHLIANLEGQLDENTPSGFTVFARYSSLENFDLRIQSDELNSTDLAPFFPTLDAHVISGTAQPSIRVSGYPRRTMVVGLELPFNAFELRESQPFPLPAEGLITALASYDMNTHLVTVNTAKTISPEFEGQIAGTISFAQDPPELDLKLEVEQFAMDDVMALATGAWLQDRGSLSLDASDPYRFFVTLKGSIPESQIGVEAQLGAGSLQFTPTLPSLPEANLQFNLLSLSWRSDAPMPTGRLSLNTGTLHHAASGLNAEGITGTLVVGDGRFTFDPLVAQVAGNAIRGSLDYALDTETLKLDLSGDLAAVEEIGLISQHRLLGMRGPVTIDRLSGTITPNRYRIDTTVDLTRTHVDWEWWITKRTGIGARVQDLHIDIVPGKTMGIKGTAALDTALISAEATLKYSSKKWELQSLDATSPELEMRTIDKVLNLPYAISGGTGKEASLQWRRKSSSPEEVELRVDGSIDELSLIPAETTVPITGRDIVIKTIVLKSGDVRTGTLDLAIDSATLPPFGTPWLLPLREKGDPSYENFPALDRDWKYTLKANDLTYPPWQGSGFNGLAFASPDASGLQSFEATIGDGSVSGMYSTTRPDNVHHLDAKWDKVPATTLLEHLKLPAIFTGTMTGGIAYEVDGDDGGTLSGTGYFDVLDGQFSADYLFNQFGRQITEASITLPPSMKFSRFSADVALEGDVIKTSNMLLESDAARISGEGQFVSGGDINYRLKLALPPDTAKGIPALRTYFNLDGLKHSQTDLELAFRITGPSFAPRMELDGLPSVGDTIVSGAVEVTSDVMKVVDLPRQILLDLFKIGGGIVGAGGKKAPTE